MLGNGPAWFGGGPRGKGVPTTGNTSPRGLSCGVARAELADQHAPAGGVAEAAVPDARPLGQLHGLGAPVPVHRGLAAQAAAVARAAGRPSLRPFNAGRPRRPVRGGAVSNRQALAGSRVVHVVPGHQQRLAVVGGVPDPVHVPVAGTRR